MSSENARHRLRILVIDSLPNSKTGFRFDRKVEAIQARLAPHIEVGLVELIIAPATSPQRLKELLDKHWIDILHIICHAEESDGQRKLVFEDRIGYRLWVTASDVAALFASLRGHAPELLTLEVCRSLPIARELLHTAWGETSAGIIGTAHTIATDFGTNFFATLYHAIAGGLDVPHAFEQARRDLELMDPNVAETPVLVRGPRAHSLQIASGYFGRIRRTMNARAVRRSEHLAPLTHETFGRRSVLGELDRCWFDGQIRRLVLSGEPGIGKTHVLRNWLDSLAHRGWWGASRVFTWSFAKSDPPNCIHTFLEDALDFFGDRAHPSESPIHAARARGVRLGRLLRREPFLLVLDHVVPLPRDSHSGVDEQTFESRFHPALAALLHEIRGADAGLCVLTTSTRVEENVNFEQLHHIRLEGLEPEAAEDFLWHHGLIDENEALSRVAHEVGRHPLALQIVANAFATARAATDALRSCLRNESTLSRALRATGALEHEASRTLLQKLLLVGGSLDDKEIGRLEVVRSVCHKGLIRPYRSPPRVELIHRALAEPLLHASCSDHLHVLASGLQENRARGEAPPLESQQTNIREQVMELRLILAHADNARMAMRCGAPAEAIKIFVEKILRQDPKTDQWSYISRKLGATAEELEILACFFRHGSEARIDWGTLDEKLAADSIVDTQRALLFHRAGLCLRHLGRLNASIEPLDCARSLYRTARNDEANRYERAAICGNDLAEVYLRRGELALAQEAIKVATADVARAEQATEADELEILKAKVICHATSAYLHHLLAEHERAVSQFADVVTFAKGFPTIPAPCSRPGFMLQSYQLDRLEQLADRDAADALIVTVLKHIACTQEFDGNTHVANVTRSLTKMACGRLFAICAYKNWSIPKSLGTVDFSRRAGSLADCPRESSTSATIVATHETRPRDNRLHDQARENHEFLTEKIFGSKGWPSVIKSQEDLRGTAHELLSEAIRGFRESQHIWMLPEALLERAHLRRLVEPRDPVNARLDIAEARRLALEVGMPRVVAACDAVRVEAAG